MLIAFSGEMGSGKDTWGECLKEINPKAIKYSFADPLKEELNSLINDFYLELNPIELAHKYKVEENEIKKAFNLIKKPLQFNNSLKITDRIPETRALLQFWGTDVRRKQDKDFWVKIAKERISNYLKEDLLVYITDNRFLNESALISELNGKIIFLEIGKETKIKRLMSRDNYNPSVNLQKHSSEMELNEIKSLKNTIVINVDTISIEEIPNKLKEIL